MPATPTYSPLTPPRAERLRTNTHRHSRYAETRPVPPLKGLREPRAASVSYRASVPAGHAYCEVAPSHRALAPAANRQNRSFKALSGKGSVPAPPPPFRHTPVQSRPRPTATVWRNPGRHPHRDGTFTFSAKERDSETGYSYFGSRYYSSDLSIWLSVDPMSDKYASLSPYTYCANNPVKLVDPNGEEFSDDIVIHGKNNSSITIKTKLVDWEFDVNLDFRGNYEVSPDNVAIGYEYGVDASGRAGVGTSYNAYKQSVMFLGGLYAGYWYDYIGGEAQIDVSLSVAGNIGYHKNMFIAINNNPATYNPKDFAGEYSGASLSFSFEALGGISLDSQFARSKDGTWSVISLGCSGSAGAQVGLFLGFDATAGAHLGGLKLITSMKPTKSRSLFDIGKNWASHLFY